MRRHRPIIEKFSEDEPRQAAIVRILKKKYLRSKTYRKRQHFILMCTGRLMNHKAIFEKFFKRDFLALVADRVPNVRILMAQALRHHFLKEISGEFIFDEDFNKAVRVLKNDECEEVRIEVSDIEVINEGQNEDAESTLASARVVEEFL